MEVVTIIELSVGLGWVQLDKNEIYRHTKVFNNLSIGDLIRFIFTIKGGTDKSLDITGGLPGPLGQVTGIMKTVIKQSYGKSLAPLGEHIGSLPEITAVSREERFKGKVLVRQGIH
tara:strand:+ start:208 stop:555 length:348 start_codon:yes stop_codon:yes gene_type:complete